MAIAHVEETPWRTFISFTFKYSDEYINEWETQSFCLIYSSDERHVSILKRSFLSPNKGYST